MLAEGQSRVGGTQQAMLLHLNLLHLMRAPHYCSSPHSASDVKVRRTFGRCLIWDEQQQ